MSITKRFPKLGRSRTKEPEPVFDVRQNWVPRETVIEEITDDDLRRNMKKGCVCNTCGQFVKLYQRPISAGSARALILLHRAQTTPDQWVDIKEIDVRGGDYAKLRFWGLLEAKDNSSHANGHRDSGHWRPTQNGIDFIHGRIAVPKYLIIYNKIPRGLAGDPITIHNALANDFDYNELMSS